MASPLKYGVHWRTVLEGQRWERFAVQAMAISVGMVRCTKCGSPWLRKLPQIGGSERSVQRGSSIVGTPAMAPDHVWEPRFKSREGHLGCSRFAEFRKGHLAWFRRVAQPLLYCSTLPWLPSRQVSLQTCSHIMGVRGSSTSMTFSLSRGIAVSTLIALAVLVVVVYEPLRELRGQAAASSITSVAEVTRRETSCAEACEPLVAAASRAAAMGASAASRAAVAPPNPQPLQ